MGVTQSHLCFRTIAAISNKEDRFKIHKMLQRKSVLGLLQQSKLKKMRPEPTQLH